MEQYPQKKYSMTHAELSAYASVLVEFVTRDLTDFADYGITTDDVTALQDMQNAFELYPIDDSFVGLSTIVRAERDAIRAQLLEKIQQIAMRFELAFGTVESPYLQLSIGDISNQSDEAFLLKSRSIISVLTEHAADVLPYGQTAPLTDAYIALAQDLEDKINAVVIANSNRSQATRTRINMGNELYDTVLRFTNIGKLIYQNTNSAKYQDYVIYGSAPAVAVHGAPSGLHFTDETTLAWTAIDNATSYGISVSSDGGSNWQADISTPTNSSSVPTVSVGKLYYKVRGHNSTGYGEYSGTFEKLFGLSTVDNFFYSDNQFTWNPVEFANGYDIQYSLSGEENWVLVFNGNATSFDHTPASGSWTYRIRASYGSIKSEWVELAVEGV